MGPLQGPPLLELLRRQVELQFRLRLRLQLELIIPGSLIDLPLLMVRPRQFVLQLHQLVLPLPIVLEQLFELPLFEQLNHQGHLPQGLEHRLQNQDFEILVQY